MPTCLLFGAGPLIGPEAARVGRKRDVLISSEVGRVAIPREKQIQRVRRITIKRLSDIPGMRPRPIHVIHQRPRVYGERAAVTTEVQCSRHRDAIRSTTACILLQCCRHRPVL